MAGTVMDYDPDRNMKTNFKNSIGHLIRETPSQTHNIQQFQKADPNTGQQYVTVRMTV
jgi:hypothetical protein